MIRIVELGPGSAVYITLTVWNLYERSTGGITFVLNSGNHWMHNANSGGNWFIQLSGWLPVTGDTADLPDPELYPASLAPPDDDPQELADRELLRRRPGLEASLRADQQVAESCSSEASARAAAAAKLLTEADAALAAVTGQLRSSNEAVTQAAARLASAEEGALGAVASAVAARERLLASKGALAEAEQAASKACELTETVKEDSEGGAADTPRGGDAWAEERRLLCVRELVDAASALDKAEAACIAAEVALPVMHQAVAEVEAVLSSMAAACGSAERRSAELRKAESLAAEAAATAAEATSVVRRRVDEAVGQLEREGAEARGRVSSRVEKRQLLELKRWLSEEGPEQPLVLKWWVQLLDASAVHERDVHSLQL